MNVGVIEQRFQEVGFNIDGVEYGVGFDGTAYIDWNKKVVAIALDPPKRGVPAGHMKVPEVYDREKLACVLADIIQDKYEDEIEDKLNEKAVEIGEASFISDRDEHCTHRVIRGHAA